MTSEVPWLKRIPLSMDLGQRVLFEGIDIACDIVQLDMRNMRSVLSTSIPIQSEEVKIPLEQRWQLFRSAWSIVDRLDAIRLILNCKHMRVQYNLIEKQKQLLRDVRAIRNKMDHIGNNWQNFKTTRKMFPLFGFVAFVWYKDDDIIKNMDGQATKIRGQMITGISINSLHHQFSLYLNLMMNGKLYEKFGNLTLFAFNNHVSLDDACEFTHDLRVFLNRNGEQCWLEATNEAVARGELTRERQLQTEEQSSLFTVRQTFDEWVDVNPV